MWHDVSKEEHRLRFINVSSLFGLNTDGKRGVSKDRRRMFKITIQENSRREVGTYRQILVSKSPNKSRAKECCVQEPVSV